MRKILPVDKITATAPTPDVCAANGFATLQHYASLVEGCASLEDGLRDSLYLTLVCLLADLQHMSLFLDLDWPEAVSHARKYVETES